MFLAIIVLAALFTGYLIPVLASLFFTMLVGKLAPKQLSENGHINSGFVAMHVLVWTAACLISGYAVARMMPEFQLFTCVGCAVLILGTLFANVNEMKKRQGILQFGSQVAGTILGIAAGFGIFLKDL